MRFSGLALDEDDDLEPALGTALAGAATDRHRCCHRVVQGSRREIHGAAAKVASDQWHTLRLRAEGDRFTVGFDGTTLFTATDRTFAGAGKVAPWTKADSVMQFDGLTIRALP